MSAPAVPLPAYARMQLAIIVIAAAAAMMSYIGIAKGLAANGAHVAADFIVFWTAAAAGQPYHFEALTAAQHWYMNTDAIRPFAYPPSFLPWLAPFAILPLKTAYLLWTVSTAALFCAAWSRIVAPKHLLLAAAAPVVVLALIPGQVVFLVGALLVSSLMMVERRPLLAGVLLGIAATIKPQALLLVPLALVAGKHWRVLSASAATGMVIGGACLLLQGGQLWLDWLKSLPRFMDVVRDGGMMHFGITPASALVRASVEGPAASAILAIAAALGVLTVWQVFRATKDVAHRMLAINAPTLLLLPYAMPYELALSAPAAAAMLIDRRLHPAAAFAAFLLLTGVGHVIGTIFMCLLLLWLVRRGGEQVLGEETKLVPI